MIKPPHGTSVSVAAKSPTITLYEVGLSVKLVIFV